MHLIIDGLIYQQLKVGGVSRIFNEILPRMCDIDSSLDISIVTTNTLKQPLPTHNNICQHGLFPIDKLLKPAWVWRKLGIRSKFINWKIGSGSEKIWHSTYFTRLNHWLGKEIVTAYDMIYERYPNYFYRQKDADFLEIKKESILGADAVICISKNTQDDLIDLYNLEIEKTHVVPLACNTIFVKRNESTFSPQISNNKPFLLYVGERPAYKNFSTFLKGYSCWKFRNDVDVVAVGRDWSDAEKITLGELNLQDNIHLAGNISDDFLVNLYNQALAFVFPSLYEGFGIPLLEAMACGCPIVASRIPTTLEVAGEVPFYFDSLEIESLLSALDAVYQQGTVSQKVLAGLELVKNYSWDRTARETFSIYQTVSSI